MQNYNRSLHSQLRSCVRITKYQCHENQNNTKREFNSTIVAVMCVVASFAAKNALYRDSSLYSIALACQFLGYPWEDIMKFVFTLLCMC